MFPPPQLVETEVFAAVPQNLRKTFVPPERVAAGGGGVPAGSFLEGPSFDREGNFLFSWGSGEFKEAHGLKIVNDNIYVLGRGSSLIALDPITGKEIWVHENLQGITARGVNYWQSKDGKDRRLIFEMNNYIQEIDANTGKSILTFGTNGLVDLKQGLGRDPKNINRIQSNNPGKVFENLLILGSAPGEAFLSAPGDLRAFRSEERRVGKECRSRWSPYH